MKRTLRFLLLLVAWAALGGNYVWAQTCNQTSSLVYRQAGSTLTTDIEKRAATETVNGTSFTYGGYASTATGTTTNDIFQLTSDQQGANLDARMLVWRQNNTGIAPGTGNTDVDLTSPYAAQVTLTFTREVSNLSFVVQDIDKSVNGNGGSNFTDELAVYALNGAGTRVDLTNANIGYGVNGTATSSTINTFIDNITINGVVQDAVRGVTLNGGVGADPSQAGNVTFNFPSPVRTVRLTFRNLSSETRLFGNPASVLRLQTIGIEQIAWCAQADVATTLAGPATATPGSTVTYVATIANNGTDAVTSVQPTVQLSQNLINVMGGTYVPSTGLLTLATIPNLAAGTSVTRSITYTMPSSTVTGQVSVPAGGNGVTTAGSSANDVILTNNNGSLANANVTTVPVTTISGTIFDDVNYGGGAGRTLATATASATASGVTASIGSVGTVVELYRNDGTLAATTTTTTGGAYSFPNIVAGTYTVRVVNSTVNSVRNAAAATVAVQTFRTNSAAADVNRVGGEAPEKIDAAANTGAQTLASLTSGTGINSLAPQSISTVTVAAAPVAVTGVDFGFNFDTVVNTRDAGQGSLRQFILNSNLLGGENTLAQAGSYTNSLNLATGSTAAGRAGVALPTGVESSIFMIPANRLTNGVAFITPTTALPQITGANTAINGSTQTFNIGNSNDLLLGAGGTVGTALTTLNQLNGPEVQLIGTQNIDGISVAANNTTVRGLSIYGFNTGVRGSVDNQGTRIDQNVIGASAISFTDPTGTNRNLNEGVNLNGSDNGFVTNNLIGFNGGMGVWVLANGANGANDNSITGNEIRGNGLTTIPGNGERLVFDGLELQGNSTRNTVSGNLITASVGHGIDSFGNDIGGNTVSGNTISNNGVGVANGTGEEGSGLRVFGTTNPTSISRNVLTGNNGSGVLLVGTANQVRISENSTSGNTRLGIDLLSAAEGGFATAPGTVFWNGQIGANSNVTLNDSGDGDGGGNGLLNFPVLTTATLNATTLVINGFARPGSLVELFLATPLTTDPTGSNRNFGQGSSFLASRTEGNNAEDTNTGVAATYGPGAVNGIAQGTDTTVPFTFSIALNTLTPAQRTALLSGAATLTSTATLANSTSEFSGNLTLPVADVTTTLAGPVSLNSGQLSGSYSVAFTNNGPSPATSVTRQVTLPVGVTNVVIPATATYDASTRIINFGTATTLAGGASNLFTFSFTAPAVTTPSSVAIVSNVTTASSQGLDAAPNAATLTVALNTPANVAAIINPGAASVAIGQPASFTATFSNAAGVSTADNVVASVQLPAGLGTVTASNGGVYDNATGLVTYTGITSLAAAASTSSLISFTAPATGPVTGTASISTTTSEAGQTANNSQSASIIINQPYDVTTSITGPTTTEVGVQTTFSVMTINNGPAMAPSVAQTVTGLPINLTNVYISNGGTYDAANGMVTFPVLASLANGARADNTISFTPTVTNAAGFTATARVATTPIDSNIGNNTSTTSLIVTDLLTAASNANIYTTITASADNVAPGALLTTFTVTSGNRGANSALLVAQRTTLPAGLLNVEVRDNAGNMVPNSTTSGYNSATGVVIIPNVASVASGATTTYTISLTAPTSGVVAAVATISSNNEDSMPADNIATADVTISPVTDVTVRLTGPNAVGAGATATYTVTTTNNGPVTASNVATTVAIPLGLTNVMVSGGGVYSAATGVVTFPAITNLLNGANTSNTITYAAPNIGTFTNVAAVFSTTTDNVPANNTAPVVTVVKPLTDVTVALSGPASIVQGNQVDYVVAAVNNGPSPAAGVVIKVQLPAGLTGVIVSAGANYDIGTGVVTFATLPTQLAGVDGAVSYGIRFVAPATLTTLYAAATVSTTSEETNYINNTASVVTPATPATAGQADLQITVSPDDNTPNAGQSLILSVVTTNLSTTTTATNVVRRVAIDPNLTGVVVNNGGIYDPATGVITFPAIASLAPGVSAPASTITLTTPGVTPLTTRGLVTGDQSDPVLTNNVDFQSIPVNSRADVATTISGPTAAQPGEPVTYTVATLNNGLSVAGSVVQKVTLPAGATNIVLPAGASQVGNEVTFATITNQVAGPGGQVLNTISFTTPAFTTSYAVTANVTLGGGQVQGGLGTTNDAATLTTTRGNRAPVANAIVNTLRAPEGNTAGALSISSLSATDADGNGTISFYNISNVPNATTQGTLRLGNTTIVNGARIEVADIANLTFDPVSTFVGNAFFTYTATDAANVVSAPAIYTIAVGQDISSVYATTNVRGGATPYTLGYVVANVFDVNGGVSTSATNVTNTGIRTATLTAGTLPPGTTLDAVTGIISVNNLAALVAGTYSVTISTIDAYGGTNLNTFNITIGVRPLPVELVAFTATALKNVDAVLVWRTASEKNNDHFEVERSLNGTDYVQIGRITGQGATSLPTDYTLTDAGIGAKTPLAYYRLKQVDTDGTSTFSPVRTVAFTKALVPAIALYPNPATATTKLDLTQLPTGTYQVSVLDATGRVVLASTLQAGLAHALDLNPIAAGTYTVLVRGQAVNLTKRLIKE